MEIILLTIGLLLLGFAGISIKLWANKDGEFAGTCASQSPFLNTEGETCSLCGKVPSKDCQNQTIDPA